MLATVASSFYTPWWRLQAGPATVNADPFFASITVLGVDCTAPLMLALNVGTLSSYMVGGAALIICALRPMEGYSRHLLAFGWKRPVYTLAGFTVALAAVRCIVPLVAAKYGCPSLAFPLVGSSAVQLPSGPFKASITVEATASFTHSFLLGAAAAALSVLSRIRCRKP